MLRSTSSFLIIALLIATPAPAKADFFDDLGDALGKAADGIGDVANDVGNTVNEAFTEKKPEQPAPQQQAAQPPAQIYWSQPAPTSPPTTSTLQVKPPRGKVIADDAPPPRPAPPRRPVSMVNSLAPLPGYTEAAPKANFQAAYAPANLSSANLPKIAPSAAATAKPAAVVTPKFMLAFENRRIQLSDSLVSKDGTKPDKASSALVRAVADKLKTPGHRVTLKANAAIVDGHLAEARQRSFARAKLVQNWLEDAGVRTTQIDLKVEIAMADSVSLDVYKSE